MKYALAGADRARVGWGVLVSPQVRQGLQELALQSGVYILSSVVNQRSYVMIRSRRPTKL